MIEHLAFEHHQKHQCIYCGSHHSGKKWSSSFARNIHYKELRCGCGKISRIKVGFHGSGHDSWDDTHSWKKHARFEAAHDSIEPLESRIKKIDTPKPSA